MTACTRPSGVPALPLIHIRRGYVTACHDLQLAVENAGDGWTAEVRDPHDGRTLYNARRCSLEAAKVATAEFAMFRVTVQARQTPEALARELRWKEYW
jgi:hypothetical protein